MSRSYRAPLMIGQVVTANVVAGHHVGLVVPLHEARQHAVVLLVPTARCDEVHLHTVVVADPC
jgi:hypothetical protein